MYNLSYRMADIQPEDVIVDPMCGGGCIGIEVCKIVFVHVHTEFAKKIDVYTIVSLL